MNASDKSRSGGHRLIRGVFGLLLGCGLAAGASSTVQAGQIHEEVRQALSVGRGAQVDVIVQLRRPSVQLRRGDNNSLASMSAQIAQIRARVIAEVPGLAQRSDIHSFSHLPLIGLTVDQATASALARHPDVVSVTYNEQTHASMAQAGAVAHVPDAIALGYRGAGITVAVLDTGIDTDHADFTVDNAIAAQFCALGGSCPSGTGSAEDGHGHGTHVSGIITRNADGTAPDARIAAVKVLADSGSSTATSTLDGMNWVIANHAATNIRVVNMSLGGQQMFASHAACDAARPGVAEAFEEMRDLGIIPLVATGNDASITGIASPACNTGAVAVGSSGDATFSVQFSNCADSGAVDKISCYSNTNYDVATNSSLVTLVAPGCMITSSNAGGGTAVNCGTSMATPFAAGIAASLLGREPALTPDNVTEILVDSATPVTDFRYTTPPASTFEFMRIDLLAAHQLMGAAPPPTDLVATTINPSQIDLDWVAPVDATPTGYRIERLSENDLEWVQLADIGATLEYTDAAPKCGLQSYRVRSLDNSSPGDPLVSIPSNIATATAFVCPLAPTGLAVAADGDDADLSWTDNALDETGFVVQRRINGGAFTTIDDTLAADVEAFTDVAPGCGFAEYRVAALRNDDISAWSNTAGVGFCIPENDLFANATVVPPGVDVTLDEANITLATESVDDPDYSCRFGGAGPGFSGVWYSVTPTEEVSMTVSSGGSSGGIDDTLISILTHDGTDFTELDCNDDIDPNGDFLSELTFTLDAGETYYVFVSLWSDVPAGTVGTLSLDFSFADPLEAPEHDLFANARVIDENPYADSEPLIQGATVSGGDPVHSCRTFGTPSPGTNNVWYSFVAPSNGEIDVDTVGSSGSADDTLLSVYTGTHGAFVEVGCNDDGDGPDDDLQSRLTGLTVTAGTTYTIYASRWSDTPAAAPGTLLLNFAFEASTAPSIVVDDQTIEMELVAGTTGNDTLVIGNEGDANLTWTIAEADAAESAGYVYGRPGGTPYVSVPGSARGVIDQATGVVPQRADAAPQGAPIDFIAEGFENFAALTSAGWAIVNNSAPTGTRTWFQGIPEVGNDGIPGTQDDLFDSHAGAPGAYGAVNFASTAGTGTISNWLISPEASLQDGMTVSFYTRTVEESDFPDRIEVRLSTDGASTDVGATATSVGDFTTVLATVNPSLTVGGYPEEWTLVTATLTGIAPGATGRVAVRYFVTDGGPEGDNSNYLGIDTFVFGTPTGCDAPTDQAWLSVAPAAGTTLPGAETDVTVGFDATALEPGTYEAQLCVNSNDTATPRVAVPVSLTVTPAADPLTLAPATLPDGAVNEAYAAIITATGDDAEAPITFAVTSVDGVPPGLTLFANGNLTGTPTTAGSYTFTVTATDSSTPTALTGSLEYTVVIEEADPVVEITPASLPRALIDAPYSVQLEASGTGTVAPFTFDVTTGTLPAGVTLTSDGLLSGTPSEVGTFNFTVTAEDSSPAVSGGPFAGTVDYTLLVVDEFIFADGFEDANVLALELESSGTKQVRLPVASELAFAGDHQQPIMRLLLKGRLVGMVEGRCAAKACEVRVSTRAGDAKWNAGPWWALDNDPYTIEVDVGAKLLRSVKPAAQD